MLDLADQLLGAGHRLAHAAGSRGIDQDLADQVTRLVGGRLQSLQHHADLVVADAHARAVASVDHAVPADLDAHLVAQGVEAQPHPGELGLQLVEARVVVLGQLLQGIVDLVLVGDDLELLILLHPVELLHLQMLIDEGAQRLLLDLRHVLGGGRHAGGEDQEQGPLAQVIGGDHVVVDESRDAAGKRGASRRRGRGGGR